MALVARFCGFPCREEIEEQPPRGDGCSWDELVYRCSFEFMKAHSSKFDEQLVFRFCNPRMGLPTTARSTKLRSAGSTDTIGSPAVARRLRLHWRHVIGKAFPAIPTYRHLLDCIRAANGIDYVLPQSSTALVAMMPPPPSRSQPQ